MKERTSITVSKSLLAKIDRLAAASKRSRSAFIGRVLREYVRDRARAAVHARDFARINRAAERLKREARGRSRVPEPEAASDPLQAP